jgi:hypothetical protein
MAAKSSNHQGESSNKVRNNSERHWRLHDKQLATRETLLLGLRTFRRQNRDPLPSIDFFEVKGTKIDGKS